MERTHLLERTLTQIRESVLGEDRQQTLLIGPRGIGNWERLLQVAVEVEKYGARAWEGLPGVWRGLLGRYADAIAMPTEPSPNPHLDIIRGAQLAGILKRSGEIERVRIRWHLRPSQSRDTLAKRRWCGGENADGTSAHWINSSPYLNGLQARPTLVDRRQRWQTVA